MWAWRRVLGREDWRSLWRHRFCFRWWRWTRHRHHGPAPQEGGEEGEAGSEQEASPVLLGPYHDVTGERDRAAVFTLHDLGVFDGTACGESMFCPDEPVKRWEAAVWLVRIVDGEDPAATGTTFADVDAGQWWAPFVERLAELGSRVPMRVRPGAILPGGPDVESRNRGATGGRSSGCTTFLRQDSPTSPSITTRPASATWLQKASSTGVVRIRFAFARTMARRACRRPRSWRGPWDWSNRGQFSAPSPPATNTRAD